MKINPNQESKYLQENLLIDFVYPFLGDLFNYDYMDFYLAEDDEDLYRHYPVTPLINNIKLLIAEFYYLIEETNMEFKYSVNTISYDFKLLYEVLTDELKEDLLDFIIMIYEDSVADLLEKLKLLPLQFGNKYQIEVLKEIKIQQNFISKLTEINLNEVIFSYK